MSADLAQEVSPRTRGLFLKNLADFQTELARIQAGFGPGFSVWAQRKELPLLVFRTLRRVQDLRLRGRELGVSFAEMHLSEGVAAGDLRRTLCAAKSTADLLQAAMVVVPGELGRAIEAYLKRNDSIYDLPTVPLLEASREELRTQAAWARSALEVLAREAGETPDPTFVARVQTLAEALPAALENHLDRTPARVATGRRMGRLPLAEAVLPAGFRPLPYGPEPLSRENEYRERERYHAVNFLQEVQAADSCASMLFEAPDMPWDFYFDLSRHLWDESRHAMFGEKKLADLGSTAAEAGLSSTAYTLRQTLAPLDRYAALATQEADAFPGQACRAQGCGGPRRQRERDGLELRHRGRDPACALRQQMDSGTDRKDRRAAQRGAGEGGRGALAGDRARRSVQAGGGDVRAVSRWSSVSPRCWFGTTGA
jgi:hypothetical protein